ncbi:MAG: flagellar basal body rod protein FlgB [Alphaproteobacteria bacterium]|nr:flagellar basal body rod protein FlgB [Alphaproteobacteria bacterium]
MLKDLALFAMAGKRMDWVARRQEVLAENVANADTPKYRARDLEAFNFRKMLDEKMPLRAAATDAKHLSPQPLEPAPGVGVVKTPFESSPDGNSVVLEEQMANMADSKGAYELSLSLFQKHLRMIKTAVGKGG